MEKITFNQDELKQFKQFIQKCKYSPSILADPALSFLRYYLQGLMVRTISMTTFTIRDQTLDVFDDDDKEKLVSSYNGQMSFAYRNHYFITSDQLLPKACADESLNCAKALLGGEVDHLHSDVYAPRWGIQPLFFAVENYSYNLVKLLLDRNAKTDVRTENGTRSLNLALEKFRQHYYLIYWTPEDSIFKLLIMFCFP
ncbi:hypothetical protein CFOL_v3_16969 [Cephalotus follicularis]|uniref:Hsp70-interacting protein N-terminal domain-containing protein n=1 Tax=Cephalotus follicularis TaxID=3775 RepID=A0A1Q3BZN3_CEPFO|nr:hypothetical protein CFOL_v3_16969 [Cephalotus follicularis]